MTDQTPTVLRILATTDLHGAARDFDYGRGVETGTYGLTRVASLIAAARAEEPLTVLFDCGDSLFGSPLTDTRLDPGGDTDNPILSAMEALNYTAIGLGNHDFDLGLGPLAGSLSQSPVPVIASNVSSPSLPMLLPSLTHTITPQEGPELRIGVLAVIAPSLLAACPGIDCQDGADAVRQTATQLREDGCDLVIGLAHGDLEAETALGLALTLHCDVILEGHPHKVVTRRVQTTNGHPRGHVQPGFWGSHLGIVDVALVPQGDRWTVDDLRCTLRKAGGTEPTSPPAAADPSITALTQERHDSILAHLSEPVAAIDDRLHSYMSVLGPNRILDLISAAQLSRAQAILGAPELPLLSAASLHRTGGIVGPGHFVDIPAGPVTRRDLSMIYGYPNRLAVVKITGAQLRRWIGEAARLYRPLQPGLASQPFLDQAIPSYQADRIYGARYEIDLAHPTQIGAVFVNGGPLQDDQEVLVAASDFRINGGRGFGWLQDAERILDADAPIQQLVEARLRQGLPPAQDAPFRLRWPPGATATALTGPAFAEFIPCYPELEFFETTLDPSGYLRLHFGPRGPI